MNDVLDIDITKDKEVKVNKGGRSFGFGNITEELYEYICKTLPYGSTILELGSGWGTSQLVKHYTVHSVEHSKLFWDRYHTNYIHVPLKQHKAVKNHDGDVWYDAKILRRAVVGLKYDLLLIDGPPVTRAGFVKYFDIFNPHVIMIFDDVNRKKDNSIMNSIASKLEVPYITYGAGTEKLFGVINDPIWGEL